MPPGSLAYKDMSGPLTYEDIGGGQGHSQALSMEDLVPPRRGGSVLTSPGGGGRWPGGVVEGESVYSRAILPLHRKGKICFMGDSHVRNLVALPCVCVCVCLCVCVCALCPMKPRMSAMWSSPSYACMYACMHGCMHACMYLLSMHYCLSD